MGGHRDIIFIDFEGFRDGDPVFVGFKDKSKFQQYAFDQVFSDQKLPRDKRLNLVSFDCFIKDIYHSEKLIAHFTSHEVEIFSKIIPSLDSERFLDIHKLFKQRLKRNKSSYADYKKMPEWNKKKKFSNPRWTLKTMLKFTGFKIKEPYGKGLVTKWMKSVYNGVSSQGELAKMQKLNLTNLLKHNKTDVDGIEHIFHYVHKNLASPE